MLSVQEFSSKIKQKYPEYANVDDTELAKKVVAKYPEYQGKVNFNEPAQGGNPLSGIGNFLGGHVNFVNQAGGEIMRGVGNIIGTTGQIVDPVTNINRLSRTLQGKFQDDGGGVLPRDWQLLERGGKAISDVGNRSANIAQQESLTQTGKTEDDISTWGGRYFGGGLTDVASTLAGSALGTGAVQKGAGLLSKFIPAGKAISTAVGGGQKGLTFGQKLAQGAKSIPQNLGRIAGETQGLMATENKLMSPQDLASSASIEGGINLLTKGGAGLAKGLLGTIPKFTPGQKGASAGQTFNRVKDLMYENVGKIPLSGKSDKILKNFEPLRQEAIAKVDDIIAKAQNAGAKTTTIDTLKENLVKDLSSQKALQKAGIPLDQHPTALKSAQAVEDFYDNLFKNKNINLQQAQELKKGLNKVGGADKIIKLTDQFREGLQKRTREFIENEVGNTLGETAKKELQNQNLNYNAFKILNNNLKKKGNYSGFLTDTLAATSAAADNIARGDIAGATKAAIIGVALKKSLASTPTKIGFAKIAKAAENPTAKFILRTLIKSPLSGRKKEL